MRNIGVSVGVILAASLVACGQPQKSARGFRLPDGDPARGEAVFVEMQCHACHTVVGAHLPTPVVEPELRVTLGGPTTQLRNDGGLVTSIINPSHRLAAAYRPRGVAGGRLSRMGDFSEAMTVRDVIDLVAFLQAHYEVVPIEVVAP